MNFDFDPRKKKWFSSLLKLQSSILGTYHSFKVQENNCVQSHAIMTSHKLKVSRKLL